MSSGPLVWAGDHFTYAELAQLRETCENEALAWLCTRLTNTSSNTSASVVVLVIPEDAIKAGVVLNLDRINSLDPPLKGESDGEERDAGGRSFLAVGTDGRVKVYFNGVVAGISHLNNLTNAGQRVDLSALQSALAERAQYYRKAQQHDLGLEDKAWLAVSLLDSHGLGARYRQNSGLQFQYSEQQLTVSRVAVPEILLGQSEDAQPMKDSIHDVFKVIYSAFGMSHPFNP